MRRESPTLAIEASLWARGARCVAGVDEVGRGPLAGPLAACAVVLDPGRVPVGIEDSKRLSPGRRERLAAEIRATAAVGLGVASVEEVERLNPLGAAMLAMARAVAALPLVPDHVLVDGPHLPSNLPCAGSAVVGGDLLSASVAAASIVAKTWRDKEMAALAQRWPGYGWEANKGYGSESHIRALQRLGPTPIHRRTFGPVHKVLWQDPK